MKQLKTKRGRPRVEAAGSGPGRKRTNKASAIAARLQDFIQRRYMTAYEFAGATGIGQKTVYRWLRKKGSTVPDTATLVALAQATGISLDWLLLGDGPELKGADGPPKEFADQLRATVVAEVAAAEPVNRTEVEAVLPVAAALLKELVLGQRLVVREWQRTKLAYQRSVFRRAKERLAPPKAGSPGARSLGTFDQLIPLSADRARKMMEPANDSRLARLQLFLAGGK